jgi:hypothetical protein
MPQLDSEPAASLRVSRKIYKYVPDPLVACRALSLYTRVLQPNWTYVDVLQVKVEGCPPDVEPLCEQARALPAKAP